VPTLARVSDVPCLVTLHVWGVSARTVPGLMARMGRDRARLRRLPGARFVKVLGTAPGAAMSPTAADLRHWAVLACWDRARDAEALGRSGVARAWDARAGERLDVRMRPLTSRGRWSRRQPFGDPAPTPHQGPVAAVTRARLAPLRARRFWRAARPVVADLGRRPGLLLALGVGEAPLGYQGTVSLWRSADDLRAFAYRGAPHREVARRTPAERWYAEELFARLALLDVAGTYGGEAVPWHGGQPGLGGPR